MAFSSPSFALTGPVPSSFLANQPLSHPFFGAAASGAGEASLSLPLSTFGCSLTSSSLFTELSSSALPAGGRGVRSLESPALPNPRSSSSSSPRSTSARAVDAEAIGAYDALEPDGAPNERAAMGFRSSTASSSAPSPGPVSSFEATSEGLKGEYPCMAEGDFDGLAGAFS